jgi:hypothetical protein
MEPNYSSSQFPIIIKVFYIEKKYRKEDILKFIKFTIIQKLDQETASPRYQPRSSEYQPIEKRAISLAYL